MLKKQRKLRDERSPPPPALRRPPARERERGEREREARERQQVTSPWRGGEVLSVRCGGGA